MKAIKYLAIITGTIVVTAAVLFFLAAAVAPKSFNVKRTIIIHASPQNVFNQVNSFQKWEQWSPWLKRDSTIKNTYSGPQSGVGNKVSWTSEKSGDGSMENMESDPFKYIRIRLKMKNFTPFEGHFTFTPLDSGIEVTWADSGSMSYPWNIFTMLADKMMGPDFEDGLMNLKILVENNPDWRLGEFKVEEQTPRAILGGMDSCPATDIGKTIGSLYGEIGAVMKKNKLDFAGAPMAYFYSFSPDKVVLEPAIAVTKEIKGEGRVKGRTTAGGKAVVVSFFGDYALMSQAMPAIQQYMKANNLVQNGPECDIYITDPGTVKDKIQVETKMVFPVKEH